MVPFSSKCFFLSNFLSVCFFHVDHFNRKWVTINQLINKSIGNIASVCIKWKRFQNIYIWCLFFWSMAYILFKCKLIKTNFLAENRDKQKVDTSVFEKCLPVHESNANVFAQGNSNMSVATVKAEYRIHWRNSHSRSWKCRLKRMFAVQCDRETQIPKTNRTKTSTLR